jgi:hypothetical protein
MKQNREQKKANTTKQQQEKDDLFDFIPRLTISQMKQIHEEKKDAKKVEKIE